MLQTVNSIMINAIEGASNGLSGDEIAAIGLLTIIIMLIVVCVIVVGALLAGGGSSNKKNDDDSGETGWYGHG